ncbi:A/G-specific adenine glycosylase [Reichenbachiella agarivorans]|uniref:Adenine DNA glycosylase n=1 Tax=Reichenbachiella agarivorans TaxID=2979464 RepID=A0ABY6CSX0_9BACT|nr:A/G-specific adenine glycosylase [Reichenbachiella agarivorans]UXP33588.1 A/G-specific adenine glycosylase [Reichenbachiella agarivorans]
MKTKTDATSIQKLVSKLLKWYGLNYRELPWRATKDPYKIWLSEIILQQTRVAQGLSYYLKFVKHYPTIDAFAGAPIDDILKLWQGLGYYSRARNMHKCANQIIKEMNGQFPDNYTDLIQLIGIGKYTAGALASICYDEPVPAIDGNAYRVYSRLFEIYSDISIGSTFKEFFELGLSIVPSQNAGDFNQAIMELGATICLPTNPKCNTCPLNNHCVARSKKVQNLLPVKSKKIKVKNRYFDYLVFIHEGHLALHKRKSQDIWQGLYDFLLFESDKDRKSSIFDILKSSEWGHVELIASSEEYKHILTHQKLHINFHVVQVTESKDFKLICQDNKLEAVHLSDLESLAVPKPVERFLYQELSEMYNFQT